MDIAPSEKLSGSQAKACLKRLGPNIKRRREEMQLSRADFAHALGCSVQMVGHMERGTYLPSLELLIRVCALVGAGRLPLTS